jgi:molecular chaperone DnaJ
MRLGFEEAFAGVTRTLRVDRWETCVECKGAGAPRDGIQTCPQCGGTGQVVARRGFLTMASACARCGGSGLYVTRPCPRCKGEGKERSERVVKVVVPAGVGSGDTLRVPGEGEPGRNGGPDGDLFVTFEVAKHDRFEREGLDLHLRLDVTFLQAILGDRLEVETMDGRERVTLAPGTQPGHVVTLKGRGVPDPEKAERSGVAALLDGRPARGDLHVHVNVIIPKDLTKPQREALKGLQGLFAPPGR